MRGKIAFGKIINLIDGLVATLKEEVEANTGKEEWCEAEIDKTEDHVKVLKNEVSDFETSIDDANEPITTLR